jgi:hypothetical protein
LAAPVPLWLAGEPAAALGTMQEAYRAAGAGDGVTVVSGAQPAPDVAAARWIAGRP